MNGIIPEVLRRQRRISPGEVPDRWTSWARSLVGRYTPLPSRYRTPVMKLVQPQVPIYMSCQRWERHAWRFYPKINLTIGPILQETVWKSFSAFSPSRADTEPFRKYSLINGEFIIGQSAEGKVYISGMTKKGYDRPEIDSLASEHITDASDSSTAAPIRRLFRRMGQVDKPSILIRSLIEEESHKILRRVVHERRRVEEGVHKTVLLQKQKDVVLKIDQTETEPPHALRRSAGVGSQTTPPSAVNVEQLAEHVIRQIDHRIRAYRERRGKSF